MNAIQEQTVRVELIGNRGELILDRPQQKNSLIGPLVEQLHAGLRELIANEQCHVILIRGEGGCFCAGLDVKAFFAEEKPEWVAHFQQDWINFHSAVFNCPLPIVGALERFAIAGGSALAFCCDFLVVGKKSFVHVKEVELGMAAPVNVAWLTAKYGLAKAMELVVLGERQYGDDLMRLGMAQKCVEDDDILSEARAMADRLAGFKTHAVQQLKASVYGGAQLGDFVQIVDKVKAASVS